MTGITLGGQFIKHTAHMAGFTIDDVMVSYQRETGNQVIEFSGTGACGSADLRIRGLDGLNGS